MTEPRDPGAGRPRRRAVWGIVAALTAFVVVVPLGAPVWGLAIRQTRSGQATYRGHPITALEVEAGHGSVTVGPGPAGEVTVGRTLKWTFDRPRVEQSWIGGTLRLTVVCESRTGPLHGLECGVDLRVRVPAGVAVRATSTSGPVVARGLTGSVRVHTRTGPVILDGVSGPVRAQSSSGAIAGTGLAAKQVDAVSTSGAIELGFAGPPRIVNASADSGFVSIALPPGFRYRVGGTSGSGARTIDPALTDGSSSRLVNVTTASGSVAVGYPDS